jgi:non-specific serine/threonine protein kinase
MWTAAACSARLPDEFDEYVECTEAVRQICRLVSERRLLTVAGPGGSGKSRVALRAVRMLVQERFALAGWVQPPEELDVGWIEQRVTRVRERNRRVLLIVDNCEAAIQMCAPALAALIAHYPDLHVLATSREPLRVEGEMIYPVTGLPLPPAAGGMPDPDVIWNAPSVRLLLDRARSAGCVVPLTAGNAIACARICRGLDGNPLSIELAAALTAALSLTDIADHLDQGLTLFTRGYRTAQPRQRSLLKCLDSGTRLLSASARALLDYLGVFDGDFSLAAVEAVVAPVLDPLPERSLIDTLTELIDKHFVVRMQDRFRLAAGVWQYTRRNLRQAARWDDIAARHAAWCGWLAQSIGTLLVADCDDSATMALLDRENANLVAALRHGGAQAQTSAPIAEVLIRCWLRRDFEWGYRGSCLRDPSQAQLRRRDYLLARASLERRLTAEQRDSQVRAAARTRLHLGVLAVLEGDLRCGQALLRALISERPALERRCDIALARCAIAVSDLSAQAAHGRADAELAAASDLYRGAGNDNGIAFATGWRALAAVGHGDIELARRHVNDAARLAADNGDEFMTAALIGVRVAVEMAAGRHCRALELAGAEARAREHVNDGCIWLDKELASSWHALGAKRAAEHWSRGLSMSFGEALTPGPANPSRPDGDDASVLSPRELEVARMVAKGLSSVKIAQVFVISPRTVDTHVDHIRTKLGLHSRAELAAWVSQLHPS